MASEWKVVPLGDLYEFSSGLSKPRSEFGFGHGFLTFKDVLDNYFVPDTLTALVNSTEKDRNSCSVRRGDVFLTRTSETQEDLGMSCVALKDYERATFNGFTKRLRPRPEAASIVPEYAAYYFRGPSFRRDVTAMSSLSTRASLNNEMLERLTIVVPPVKVQAAIGGILKTLDDKIELNRRMNETLEAMALAIFKNSFVNVDSVRATVAELCDEGILEIGDGYRAKNSELDSEGLPFARASNLNSGFNLEDAECLCPASVAKAGVKISQMGDVAFTSKGTVGRLARVDDSTPQFVYAPQVCFWRSKNPDKLHPAILYCWMSSDDFGSQVRSFSGQTDMAPYISLCDQRRIVVPRFPLSQAVLGDRIETLLKCKAFCTRESYTLVAVRDTLLPKLLSGELDVSQAGKSVKEAP